MQHDLQKKIRAARRSFAAIAASYFMGLFNDNFYKEAALFLAVAQNNAAVQALAAGVFTVCYMLAAAPGGYWADRFAKGNVIIAAKAVELAAMVAGAVGIWTGNWFLVLTMIGLMGAQSAVFSPAMNGSIPEIYPREYVQTANTVIRILSTIAIFLGMALAGFLMDLSMPSVGGIPRGILLVGVFVLCAATVGLVVAFGAPRISPSGNAGRFPWRGPYESVLELLKIRRDGLLTVCVCGNIYIWSLAAVITLLMVNLGVNQFSLSASLTAGTKIIFLIGIACGGVLSNIIAPGKRFFNVFIPSYLVMSLLLVVIGVVPYLLSGSTLVWGVVVLIALTGVAGGVDLVPLAAFIQLRPSAGEKGRVIAAANFAVFAGMSIGAACLFVLNKLFIPTTSLAILGMLTAGFALWLKTRLDKEKGAICEE